MLVWVVSLPIDEPNFLIPPEPGYTRIRNPGTESRKVKLILFITGR
jgi:hypothetical protein